MHISKFLTTAEASKLDETGKVELILYFCHRKEDIIEFDAISIANRLIDLGYSRPNITRLKTKLTKSKRVVKGSSQQYFRLHKSVLEEFDMKYPFVAEQNDEIFTINSIIPEDLYRDTRGFIAKLAVQINSCYENKIADGCAVLMRRLIEVLLVLSYKELKREEELKEPVTGQTKNLTSIINYTISNKVLYLQKDTLEVLHDFRELGNFSAHGIQYNCRIEEINKIKRSFRFAVEDLLYCAKVKK